MTHAGLIDGIRHKVIRGMELTELFILIDSLDVISEEIIRVGNPKFSLNCIGT
jgi:hypothetical protein